MSIIDKFLGSKDSIEALTRLINSSTGLLNGTNFGVDNWVGRQNHSAAAPGISTPPPVPENLHQPYYPHEDDFLDEEEPEEEEVIEEEVIEEEEMPQENMELSFLSPHLRQLIEVALKDGVVTEAELAILVRKGKQENIDPDEMMMIVNARLYEMKQSNPQPEKPVARPKRTPPPLPGKCPNCGAMNKLSARKCDECGEPLTPMGPPPLPGMSPSASSAPAQQAGTPAAPKRARTSSAPQRAKTASAPRRSNAQAHRSRSANAPFNSIKDFKKYLGNLDKKYEDDDITEKQHQTLRETAVRNFNIPQDKNGLLEYLKLCNEEYDSYYVEDKEMEIWKRKAREAINNLISNYPSDYWEYDEIVTETKDLMFDD